MLDIQNLNFSYAKGNFWSKKMDSRIREDDRVLNNISFSITPGSIVGLLGRNGAGKSTLFSLLNGMLVWQAGTASLSGHQIAASGSIIHSAFRQNLGVVFQKPSLDKNITAWDNLILSAGVYGLSRRDAVDRAWIYLDRVGLRERGNDKVKTFSGGMQRRLELARAFMHHPKFLLMDEPATGLDEAGVRDYWRILTEFAKDNGTTILLTTHRLDEAERCERLLVMHKGSIVADETPGDFRGRIREDHIQIDLKGGQQILLKDANGASRVPALVDQYGSEHIQSIQVRKPSLADAFLAVTGEGL